MSPDHAAILAELRREGEARARTYPDMVTKGRISAREATWRRAIIAEIQSDVAAASETRKPAAGTFRWAEKLGELDRELGLRRRLYPEWVNKGRMTQADATRQLAALAEARRLYWAEMLAWEPPSGSVPCWSPEDPAYATTPAQIYRQAVRDHMAAVEAEAAPPARLFEEGETG